MLHIASIAGKEGNAGMTAYSATKAGLIGLVKSMAKDYAETGVTINALAPAVIRTPMVDALPAGDGQVHDRQDSDATLRRTLGSRLADRLDRLAGLQLHHRLHLRPERRPGHLLIDCKKGGQAHVEHSRIEVIPVAAPGQATNDLDGTVDTVIVRITDEDGRYWHRRDRRAARRSSRPSSKCRRRIYGAATRRKS